MNKLLAEIDAFLAASGMAASTLGRKSVNDGKCIERLRRGGRAWPETVNRIRDFIKSSKEKAA